LGHRAIIGLEIACRYRADFVYAPSKYLANYCNERGGPRVHSIPPPAVNINFQDHPEVKTHKKYLIHFGQIGRRKGSEFIVHALKEVLKGAPDFKMIWAGSEVNPGVLNRIKEIDLESFNKSIFYIGAKPRNELLPLIKGSSAAVLPSLADNIPNTVLECVLLGVPVLGTSNSSIEEIIVDGVNGWMVQSNSISDLSQRMLSIWRSTQVSGSRHTSVLALDSIYEPDIATQKFVDIVSSLRP
jgi:glycosyltransferase involved in cell wall biosynthesis